MSSIKLYLLLLFFTPSGITDLSGVQSTPDGQQDLDLYYDKLNKNIYEEIKAGRRKALAEIPFETLMENYAEKGLNGVIRDTVWLMDYFSNDACICSFSRKEKEELLKRMDALAPQYKSQELLHELEYLRAYTLIDVECDSSYKAKIRKSEKIAEKARKRKDKTMEMRALVEMWHYSFYRSYLPEAFFYAGLIVKELAEVPEDYPFRHLDYLRMAITYYHVRDYEKALPFLKLALSEGSANYFYDESNMKACNYLASYYKTKGQLDSAEYYNRAILLSDEAIYKQPAHLAIAITNLGKLAMERGEYEQAIAMMSAGREVMVRNPGEVGFVSSLDIALGKCYLATGKLEKLPPLIKNIEKLIEQNLWKDAGKDQLYSLMSNYASYTGNSALASAYQDTAFMWARELADRRSATSIVRGEEQLHRIEKQLKDEEISRHRTRGRFIFVILMLSLSGGIIISYYYRKNKQAYRRLAEQARLWANYDCQKGIPKEIKKSNDTAPESLEEEVTDEEKEIVLRANLLMKEMGIYKDPELSLEKLADTMETSRHILSRSINRITGRNFNQYINEYKIREAVRILSSGETKIYIDELYEQVGFNSRTSFYRAFKQITGLSPSEFKKNQ